MRALRLSRLLAIPALVAGCATPSPEPDVRAVMGELQQLTDKLGYSIVAENGDLARYYQAEFAQTVDVLLTVEEHEGFRIAQHTTLILPILVTRLGDSLGDEIWPDSWRNYEAIVDGCNRCHASTGHDFIDVVAVDGEPPFSQTF